MVVFECVPEARNDLFCLSYKTGISILITLAILFEIPANLFIVYLIKDFGNQTKCVVTYMYVLGLLLISIEMLSVCCMCTFPCRITSKFFILFSILRIVCLLVVVVLLGANLKVFAIIVYVLLMLLWGYICYLANSFYPKDCQDFRKSSPYTTRHVEDGFDPLTRNKVDSPEKYRTANPVVYSCASLVTSIENASLYWMDKAAISKNVRNYRNLKHEMAEKPKINNKLDRIQKGDPEYISESETSKECANVHIMDQSAVSSAPNEYWKHLKSDKLQNLSKRDKTIKFRRSCNNIRGKNPGKETKSKKFIRCSKRLSWFFRLSEKYKHRNCKKQTTQNLGVQCKSEIYSGHEAPLRVTELYESFASSGDEALNKMFQQYSQPGYKPCECTPKSKPKKCPKPKKPPKPKKEKKKKCKPQVSSASTMCYPVKKTSQVKLPKKASSESISSSISCQGCKKNKPSKVIGQPKIQYSSRKKRRAVKHRLICIGPANDSKNKVNVQLKIEIDEPEAKQDKQCGGECRSKPVSKTKVSCDKKENLDCECAKPVPAQVCKPVKTKPVKKPSKTCPKPKVSSKSCSCKSAQSVLKQTKETQCDCSIPKKTSQKSCGGNKVEVATQKRSTECECGQGKTNPCPPAGTKLTKKKKEKLSYSSCECNKSVCAGGCATSTTCKTSNKCLSADMKGYKSHECECYKPIPPTPILPNFSPQPSRIKLSIEKKSCPCSEIAMTQPGTKLGSKTGGQQLICKSKSNKSQKPKKSPKSSKPSSLNTTSSYQKLPSPKSSKSDKCKVKKVKSDKCKIKKVKSDKCKIKKSKPSKRSWCQGIQSKCKKTKNITNMGIQCGMGSGCGVVAPCLMDKQCGKDADPSMSGQCGRSSTIFHERVTPARKYDHRKKDEGIACSLHRRTSLDEVQLNKEMDLTTLCSQDGMGGNMCIAMLDQEEGTDGKPKLRQDDVSRAINDVQDLKNAVMGDWSDKGVIAKVKESEVCVLHQTNQGKVKPHGFRTTSYLTSKILRRKHLAKIKSVVNDLHGLHLISWGPRDEEPQHRPKSGGSGKQTMNTKNET